MEQNNVGVLAIARRFPQAIAEIRRTIMNTIDKILRAEHQELLPHVDELRLLADSLDEIDSADVRPRLEHVHEFLAEHLIPHAAMEEEALYPAVARILGSPLSTATMSLDHVEVRRLTEQLNLLLPNNGHFRRSTSRPCAAYCTAFIRCSKCISLRKRKFISLFWKVI
jgi:iron-sulfur cluster repair protein YtfE (RIC family)